MEMKPNPIPHRELKLMMLVVVVALAVLLSLEKMFASLHEEDIAFHAEGVHHHLCLSRFCSMGQ
jgi:hypothetical protein